MSLEIVLVHFVEMEIVRRLAGEWKKLERYYRASGIPLSLNAFIGVLLVVALASAFAAVYVVSFIPSGAGDSASAVGAAAFFAVLSLAVAIPVSLRNARIRAIEENLPDALKHMSIVLRAGGTVEGAVSEAGRSDYGPLSAELSRALDQMRKGRNFEEAFYDAAIESGSPLFERVSVIVNDAKRAGAGVAEVMSAISEDARDINHIRRERASRTTMHVVFLYVSALFLSPFIFGFSVNIVSFIGSGISCAVPGTSRANLEFLSLLLTLFLALLGIFSCMAVGIIRYGSATRYLVRAPIMVLIALAVFEFGKRIGLFLIGGVGAQC